MHLAAGKQKGYRNIKFIYHSTLLDQSIDVWNERRRAFNYGQVFKGVPCDKKRSLASLIVNITWGLIFDDIIDLNYVFAFPHMNGGYLGVFDVTKRFKSPNKFGPSRRSEFRLRDFNRTQVPELTFQVRTHRYGKRKTANIFNGHIYPR